MTSIRQTPLTEAERAQIQTMISELEHSLQRYGMRRVLHSGYILLMVLFFGGLGTVFIYTWTQVSMENSLFHWGFLAAGAFMIVRAFQVVWNLGWRSTQDLAENLRQAKQFLNEGQVREVVVKASLVYMYQSRGISGLNPPFYLFQTKENEVMVLDAVDVETDGDFPNTAFILREARTAHDEMLFAQIQCLGSFLPPAYRLGRRHKLLKWSVWRTIKPLFPDGEEEEKQSFLFRVGQLPR